MAQPFSLAASTGRVRSWVSCSASVRVGMRPDGTSWAAHWSRICSVVYLRVHSPMISSSSSTWATRSTGSANRGSLASSSCPASVATLCQSVWPMVVMTTQPSLVG